MRTVTKTLVALSLVSTIGTAYGATPAQLARAEQTVKLAQCKLEWLQSNNRDRLAMFGFIAACLSR